MNSTSFLDLAPYIDHTFLKPEGTPHDIEKLCHESLQFGFKGVCVNSSYVKLASSYLKDSPVKVISVIGFPLGAALSETKRHEAIESVNNGAQELDMVIQIGRVKAQLWDQVRLDIESVTRSVPVPVKVILETGLLSETEIIKACEISEKAGARFVKTCTGFSTGSATPEIIKLMKKHVSESVEVKASGGIKTYEQALALIKAGATRLGTSSGVQLILRESIDSKSY